MQTALDNTVDEKVIAVPVEACKGLRELAAKRKDQVDELKEEVSSLEADLARIKSGSK